MEQLLSITDAAKRLGVSERSMWQLIHDRRIVAKTQKIGGTKRGKCGILSSEIDRYLRELPEWGQPVQQPPQKQGRRPSGIRQELANAIQYV
jgi:molybdenum-dependent DNA-binding transcriptional regulator ModE